MSKNTVLRNWNVLDHLTDKATVDRIHYGPSLTMSFIVKVLSLFFTCKQVIGFVTKREFNSISRLCQVNFGAVLVL